MSARILPALLFLLLGPSAPPAEAQASQSRVHERRSEARGELNRLLQGAPPAPVIARLEYLGEGRWAAMELVRAFGQLVSDERRRSVAQVVAALAAPPTESFLAELTTSPDGVLRMHAAIGLGRLRSKRTAALVPLLSDPSVAVRREAARALGLSGHKKAARPLLAAAKTEEELEARHALLVAVGRAGDPKSAAGLLPFLDSPSETTRLAAAQGLVLLNAPRGLQFAKGLLSSEDKFVRRQGVALFDGVPAKRAAPFLEPVLRDPDRKAAAAAARTLYQGGDASRLEWLVMASWNAANGEEKLLYEHELETLMLTDDRRRAILKKVGVP